MPQDRRLVNDSVLFLHVHTCLHHALHHTTGALRFLVSHLQAKAADWVTIISDTNALAAKLILLKNCFPVGCPILFMC